MVGIFWHGHFDPFPGYKLWSNKVCEETFSHARNPCLINFDLLARLYLFLVKSLITCSSLTLIHFRTFYCSENQKWSKIDFEHVMRHYTEYRFSLASGSKLISQAFPACEKVSFTYFTGSKFLTLGKMANIFMAHLSLYILVCKWNTYGWLESDSLFSQSASTTCTLIIYIWRFVGELNREKASFTFIAWIL